MSWFCPGHVCGRCEAKYRHTSYHQPETCESTKPGALCEMCEHPDRAWIKWSAHGRYHTVGPAEKGEDGAYYHRCRRVGCEVKIGREQMPRDIPGCEGGDALVIITPPAQSHPEIYEEDHYVAVSHKTAVSDEKLLAWLNDYVKKFHPEWAVESPKLSRNLHDNDLEVKITWSKDAKNSNTSPIA